MKKFLSIALVFCMMFSLLAGCGKDNSNNNENNNSNENNNTVQDAVDANNKDNVGESTEIKDVAYVRDSITVFDSAPTNLDPTAMNSGGASWLWSVYEMPYQVDGFGGDLAPVLVDSTKGNYKPGMDHEEGSNEYILYLQEGIIDHAGNELKASDVAFSYDLLVNSGNARGMNQYESAEAISDYACKITFKRELNLVGELVTFFARIFFISEASYNASPSGLVADACGTGPYKLAEFTSGASMKLVKNEDYWCAPENMTNQIQQANAEVINYVYASEATSQVVALGNGDADASGNLSLANAGDFQEGGKYDDEYDIHVYWDNLTSCILPNCHEDALTGDINMRLAIFYAISVEGVAAGQAADVAGSYRACYGMGNPNFPDFSENWETWENYQTVTSQEKVDEYLKAANYQGETVEIITMSGDTETIAVIIVGMLEAAGIKAHITMVDRSTQNMVKGDPTAWSLSIESWASSDYIVNVWDKLWKTTDENGYIDNALQWIKDDEFLAMCLESKTLEGHTQEMVDKVQQYIIDNAYAMGLTQKCSILVYPTDVDVLYMTDKNSFIPGATTFKEG